MGFEIINRLKKEKGLTNAQISDMSGVTLSTLDKITAGINKNPKLDTLLAICRALGCRLDDFDDTPKIKDDFINEEDAGYIRKYRKLDPHGKRMVNFVISEEAARMATGNIDAVDPHLTTEARQRRRERLINDMEKELQRITQMMGSIKFSDSKEDDAEDNVICLLRPINPIAAAEGSGAWLDGSNYEEVRVMLNDLTRKADLLLRVQGRSMEPEYFDGDQILVREQPDILDGEIGAFIIDGEGFLKQKAADHLVSLNPEVSDVYVGSFQECRCIGKVLGKLEPAWIVEK